MKLGFGLNLDWLADVAAVREIVIATDEAGFDYVTYGGHVLTAPTGRYPDKPPATYSAAFRDPFVLFANLAAVTRTIHFRTGILILPALPTALVAKQAADLSLLSGGRIELGVGISWQESEYHALDREFAARGRRLEEQIDVLRRLWTEPIVSFTGRYHQIDDLGLGQLPEAPIPIWIGSGADTSRLRRVVRLADGWMPGPALNSPEPAAELRRLASELERTTPVGVGGRMTVGPDDNASTWVAAAAMQQDLGATDLTISAPQSSASDALPMLLAARAAILEPAGA